ncbi:MAG: vitamin B12-dependent ribonucleotide reductase [Actinomycetota bacterium]|nr:vitamin B12-dependent ribonucleotide reductase [Actinomycetota bacterium]
MAGATTRTGAATGVREGLGIRRYFTTDGVHPYDEVEWELRDAVIQNYRTGEVAFEQKDIEFPKAWSQNATNIVAQKYFRGALDTPRRERSVKQMIDRVVGRYEEEGLSRGYFTDAAEAKTFADELTHLLVTQKAAFNSPVWFNVGWRPKGEEQVSACQPYGALVSTPDGLVPIGRLVEENAVGTKVFDAHGLTKIVAVKANGVKDVFRVHLRSGYTLDVTSDHLVWKAEGDGGGRFVPADELRVGDKLEWHRRGAFGGGEIRRLDIAEAALAGWLQSDGFVGRYDGTNKSLTIEAMTVNDDERSWVLAAIDSVFPDVHRHERRVETQDPALDCRRTRLYGNVLDAFVEKWGLRARRLEMEVPGHLFSAPLPVVAAYLRSIFQAEGSVSIRERSARVAVDMISEKLIRGLQQLLLRFGIFARVTFKNDARSDRKGCWSLGIQNLGDRATFAAEIGFVDARKTAKLDASLQIEGRASKTTKVLEIGGIEPLGPTEVYDIQTESGEYLSHNLRVHNCFILAVEDQMKSILNWYVEEGTIFKGGSGSGINLSTIRSSKERLRSGGTASGPVSFMRGADASAGTIKSGGATRRAAKMVVLNVDHPDIKEFIWCKALEERKARALREAGFDMDLDGSDGHSIQYQNANNSVRVTDEFMNAAIKDEDWELKAVTTGETIEKLKAKDLLRQISEAAWQCADPGVQYDSTINDWHTCPSSGRINASNPCSEYVHVDNSSCNLASLNLMKFVDEDDNFDVEGFKHAVQIVFVAQEISVGFASYPTPKIAENSYRFRQLGQGYANLGALLMSQGLAYDSDDGRAWAAAITALMTGHCYATSARLAQRVGPFGAFPENREPMLRVMNKHRAAAYEIPEGLAPAPLLEAARSSWDEAVALGDDNGYRNAQATVLAPTGTIGLMMDCDTTGIEPDLALKKMKKLVGGGTMSIVNQTVPRALRKLGYGESQIAEIVAYIDENSHVVGAPHLREEHMSVFDTAMGERSIHYMGHIRMMAAAQPFLSGAISKTVNMPEDVTVEDIEQAYLEGWRRGLKALAIYRDNCKTAQPLSVSKKAPEAQNAAAPEVLATDLPEPVRRRLPRARRSITFKFRVADTEGYLTAGEFPDRRVGEIFLRVAKQGSTLSGIMDAFAISISMGLQYGVPLSAYVKQFANTRFEPSGMTDDPEFRIATSILDYVFKRLAVEYLSVEERHALGIRTSGERQSEIEAKLDPTVAEPTGTGNGNGNGNGKTAEPEGVIVLGSVVTANAGSLPFCGTCGVQMNPAGSCFACPSCGSTSGCS